MYLMDQLMDGRLRTAQFSSSVASQSVRVVACAMIGLGSLFGGGTLLSSSAAAQDASPAAGEVVDATECLVEPLTDEYLTGLAATPQSEASPETAAAATPFTMPEGEPAGDAEVEAVNATVRELVACLNAADFRRVYALYTEDYLAMNFAGEQAEVAEATPEPTESATENALVGVSDVIVLEDGRVGAQVELVSADNLQTTVFVVLENVGDRWLIDDLTPLESEDGAGDDGDSGTPTS
jgi:ketosteroid isomerase-like protein